MCECFSPYSNTKNDRVNAGLAKKLMPISTIEKIIADAKDTPLREIIPSTMGEPLLYKEFDRIIELCKENSLKLNLTTNGSFPIKGVELWSDMLLPVLSDIKISWNGASKETHEKIMLNSKWEDVLENLKILLNKRDLYAPNNEYRPTVTLQMTFLETNFDELTKLLNMAIDLGIDRLKGHHLWAHFDEIKNLSMRRDKEAIKRWNNSISELKKIAELRPLKNGKIIKLENFDILDEKAVEDLAPGGPCPFLGKEAWFNTKGEFSPCCAPDELRKSLGKFGNIQTSSLDEIWNSTEYNNLQKDYINYDLCKSCNMRKQLAQ